MTWFAAHIIVGLIPDGEPSSITVWENVVLLEADSVAAAEAEAAQIGNDEETLDDELTVDGKPARRLFAGVRKVVRISNEQPPQDEVPPNHRSEITYSEFQVASIDDLKRLGSGQTVSVLYSE